MLRSIAFLLVFLVVLASGTGAINRDEQMTCDAGKVQWLIGELPDAALLERARIAAGAASVRVIADGMMVTQDYREDRLNLDLDAQGRVRAVRCG